MYSSYCRIGIIGTLESWSDLSTTIKFPDEIKKEIANKIGKVRYKDLAEQYNISTTTITRIKKEYHENLIWTEGYIPKELAEKSKQLGYSDFNEYAIYLDKSITYLLKFFMHHAEEITANKLEVSVLNDIAEKTGFVQQDAEE